METIASMYSIGVYIVRCVDCSELRNTKRVTLENNLSNTQRLIGLVLYWEEYLRRGTSITVEKLENAAIKMHVHRVYGV